MGIIKSLFKKLHNEKHKKDEGKGAADYFESKSIIEDLIYASREEAEMPAEIPLLTQENKTKETLNLHK